MNKVIRGFVLYGSLLVAGAVAIVGSSLLSKNHSNALTNGVSQSQSAPATSYPKLNATCRTYVKNEKTKEIKKKCKLWPPGRPKNVTDDRFMFPFRFASLNSARFFVPLKADFLNQEFKLNNSQIHTSQQASPREANPPSKRSREVNHNEVTRFIPVGFNEHFSINDSGILSALTTKGKSEKELTIPENVVQIGADAFQNCNEALETINIQSTKLKLDPSALKSIPLKTKFCVVNEAIKKSLINYGIDKSRISILSQNQNFLFIIIGATVILVGSAVAAKLIHVKIKNRHKNNTDRDTK